MRKNKPFRRLFTAYFVVITGITVVVVTHEHELVRQFHQRVVTLKKGRIISDVPADKEAIRARAERKERLFETELEPADTAEKEVATV